ncbi:MAG: TolC family protein [Verrucomicrobiota bacterium]|nr:TolC family protein [Verrucomicrobiota bacterium]
MINFRILSLIFLCGYLFAEPKILPLQHAISTALEHNLGLRIAAVATANAMDSVQIESAAFDTEIFGSFSSQARQSAATNSTLDSALLPESDNRRARLGVDKRFATGTVATVNSSINRRDSNNNAVRNPDYGAEVSLLIRQPLLKGAWTKINLAPVARAKVNAERSLFELRSDVLDLLLETEIAYWNLAYAKADCALITSSLALAENLLDENTERERLGIVTPLEVLQAKAEVLNRKENIIQAERLIQDSEDNLRRYMGEADLISESTGNIVVSDLPKALGALRPMQEVLHDTLFSDVEAKAQERRIEVERINRVIAQDATRSELDLTARLSYLGRDNDGRGAYKGAYNRDGYDWNVGVEIRIPWGFRESRIRARQATRNLEKASLQLYDIKQEKALAARSAWRSVATGLKRIEVTRSAMEINEQAFLQERARYGSGLVAYRSVLEAQRDFDLAKSKYLKSFIETLRAVVRLGRVDGTLLSRNGFSWNTAKSESKITASHVVPLVNKISKSP